jgi:hypothetical protein
MGEAVVYDGKECVYRCENYYLTRESLKSLRWLILKVAQPHHSVAPVSKLELREIRRFQNWGCKIGSGARVTLCHAAIYNLPH